MVCRPFLSASNTSGCAVLCRASITSSNHTYSNLVDCSYGSAMYTYICSTHHCNTLSVLIILYCPYHLESIHTLSACLAMWNHHTCDCTHSQSPAYLSTMHIGIVCRSYTHKVDYSVIHSHTAYI